MNPYDWDTVNNSSSDSFRMAQESQLKARLTLYVLSQNDKPTPPWLLRALAGKLGKDTTANPIQDHNREALASETVQYTKGLSQREAARFTREVWDQCVTCALNNVPEEFVLDDLEKSALFQVAVWMDLPNDDERRKILGSSASQLRSVRDGEVKTPVHPRSIPPVACVDWASAWNEDLSKEVFDLACKVQETHEKLWVRGKGQLDGVKCFQDLVLPEDPYCDNGITVLPESYQDKEVYFVGDIHGDIGALDHVLERTNFCAGNNEKGPCLIFLGDYGDRGPNTLAVWARIIWLKATYPDRVFLIRGNHEDWLEFCLTRCEDNQKLKKPIKLPAVSLYWDTFASLYYALQGIGDQIVNIYMFSEHLSSMLLMPDGLLAVHGGHLPRRKDKDGWSMSEDSFEPLRVGSLADLRKPRVQLFMRWADVVDEADLEYAWAEYKGQVGIRLNSSKADFSDFSSKTGILRMVHGHTHPSSGSEIQYGGLVVALDTSRYTTGDALAIGRYIPDKGVEPVKFTM